MLENIGFSQTVGDANYKKVYNTKQGEMESGKRWHKITRGRGSKLAKKNNVS